MAGLDGGQWARGKRDVPMWEGTVSYTFCRRRKHETSSNSSGKGTQVELEVQ